MINPTSGSVLVVEDSGSIAILATRILTRAGYTVASTATATEALAMMSQRGLPDMTGMTVLQKARVIHPGIAAVLVTGTRPGPQTLIDAEAIGEDVQVLWKPITAEDLRTAVDKARRRRRADA